MPEFSYVARDQAGQKVAGNVEASGEREALATLASRALFPVEVNVSSPVVEDSRVRRIPAQLMANTYGQLADLLQSGVPLLRAVEVIRQQTSHARLAHVLTQVQRHIEEGSTLAEAMARFERVFGEMTISMVRAGGEGGFLEEALSRVAEFTEAQEDLKKRTMGAVAYPAFLAVVGTLVVIVLVVFFVPKFSELFGRLEERGELPILTKGLLWLSGSLRIWGLPLLVALGAVGWYVKQRLETAQGRLWRDRLKLRFPVAGAIFLHLAVARFCRVLGTLLRNGVPILRALTISSDATANRVLAGAIQDATENISAGQPLAEPLGDSKQFPPMVIEMIAVAEQANNLEKVLLDIADSLERRTWRRLDVAVRLLEPVLLLILAAVVLMIVIALLLPILKMSTTI
ncbi:MAG TPA: type II secretion system F family protein [Thermoguttaceae bacterium]|nr:type II secretion system F family protein [Thermoguttaceae bacterium]